jgi:hypothetical protein
MPRLRRPAWVKIGTLTGPRPVIKPWRGLTARRAM